MRQQAQSHFSRAGRRFLAAALLSGLALSDPVGAQGLIVNEASNGNGSARDWVELLVLDPTGAGTVNINGWKFDDNNGEFEGSADSGVSRGHYFFNDPQWATVPAGALIVIYNNSSFQRDPGIPPDDPADSNMDGVYILPANDPTLGACRLEPSTSSDAYSPCTPGSPTWTMTAFRNGGDAPQVRHPDGSFYHGFSYGDVDATVAAPIFPLSGLPSFNAGAGGTGSAFGMQCGDWEDAANFIRYLAVDRTPGAANIDGAGGSMLNQTLIDSIADGTFDYGNLANPANCGVVADISIVKTVLTAGPYLSGQTVQYSLAVNNAGPDDATGVVVDDTASGLTLDSVVGGCTAISPPALFPCTIGSIAAGSGANLTVTATIQ